MNSDSIKSYFKNNPFFVIVGVLIIVFVGFEYHLSGDFSIYLSAARDLALGKDIYEIGYGFYADLPYMASPSLAYLLYPLSYYQLW